MLYPGQLACFELLVQQQIWDWIDAAEANKHRVKIRKYLLAVPGSADKPSLSVGLTFSVVGPLVKVIEPAHEDGVVGDLKVEVADRCASTCEVEYNVRYPDSIDELHAEMTGDEAKLESLAHERVGREALKSVVRRMRDRGVNG